MLVTRRHVLTGFLASAALAGGAGAAFAAAEVNLITVHKTPWCGCCSKWVSHLEAEGFTVQTREHEDLTPLKRELGVPAALESCHTAVIDGYVIEGHVPAAEVKRLLEERPEAVGLAVPGMPVGSPGMEMEGKREAYAVILFSRDREEIYASY
ncbi:DUF411 domain-containing protein [Tepidicaulis sp. LMO-SS28]|uniref:DUF411 domain-containing protein n=1 Tax=Tepidicaulis sp. LMO-SS28 TaxID=3447455 RepID=UPI003EE3270F